MRNFIITCSSTCDLSPYYLRQHNIYYVSFFYYLDGNKYYDDFYKEHSIDEFYKKIADSDVKTSQPDPNQYKELWLKLIEQGNDILHIELSSGISGAVNSALTAKTMVEDLKPDSKIIVIDSLCCSTGYGLLLDYASKLKADGKSIDEIEKDINIVKHNLNHIFATTNLEQFIKGGRISKISGGVGKVLNIIPILHVNNDGKLEMLKKARGFNNVIDEFVNLSLTNINDKENYNGTIFINHSNCPDKAKMLYDKFKDLYKNANLNIDNIFNVGTVIGAHTGIGTVTVYYFGNGRV